jgi:RNA methyltransferase, TrmH family
MQPPARAPSIDSPRNARIRAVLRLYKRTERERSGLLVAEGVWALRTALDGAVAIRDVYYCQDFFHTDELALLARARAAGAELTEVSVRALERLSFRDGPDGVISVVERPDVTLDRLRPGHSPLLCVAQTIEKPGNLGAIVRTACAANADAVIVCDAQTDAYGPAVVRASLGSLFLLPVIVERTRRVLDWLHEHDVVVCAATPQGHDEPWTVDLTRPCAIVIGNEHRGLDEEWLEGADHRVCIPMLGPMNSLNATTAAGVLLFEAVRQRRSMGAEARTIPGEVELNQPQVRPGPMWA